MAGPFRPCVVVPTRNHVRALPALLRDMARFDLPVILVDDGSDEEQRDAIEVLARAPPVVARLRHERNRGKGTAVLAGLRQAAAQGFTHALQIDADGQHDRAATPRFLELAKTHPDAVIAGKPVFDRSIPRARRAGRWLTAFWVVVHTLSFRITDSMCGFRIYPIEATLALAEATPVGCRMDFDTEVLVRLFWAGHPVAMQPVPVVYPPENFSNFDVLHDNIAISWMHTRLFFGMLARLPRLLLYRPRPSAAECSPGPGHWAALNERGAYWGLAFLAAVYRLLGRRACVIMMSPVVLYFFATGTTQRRASREYLRRLHAAGRLDGSPGLSMSFRHFMSFAVSALDTVAAWRGDLPLARLKGVNGGAFAAAKRADQGAFVLTAHLGNPEVLRAVADLNDRWRVNVLVHTRHAERFNRLLASTTSVSAIRLVQVSELGVETAIQLRQALDRGEWIVCAADRIPASRGHRCVQVPFLGAPASFPEGPFILAALLEAPVFSLFCVRENGGYRVSFEELSNRIVLPREERTAGLRKIAGQFVARLETKLTEVPLQWYNFYDFWAAELGEPPSAPQRSDKRPSPHTRGASISS